jgi:hypothetical protein
LVDAVLSTGTSLSSHEELEQLLTFCLRYCGSTNAHCEARSCQKGYGSCNEQSVSTPCTTEKTAAAALDQSTVTPLTVTITVPGSVTTCLTADTVTITIPTTITFSAAQGTVTTAIGVTVAGAGEITTVTAPTTITISGQGEVVTVTEPTTLTIPGAGETTTVTVPTTITIPGQGEVVTVTEPTTLTIPGAGETTTVTVPTTITIPGEGEVTTQFVTITSILTSATCSPSGGYCDCNNPGMCCGGACLCSNEQGPVSTCLF